MMKNIPEKILSYLSMLVPGPLSSLLLAKKKSVVVFNDENIFDSLDL